MTDLDESLPGLMYHDDDDDDGEALDYDKIRQPPRDVQSSLFSEIHSLVCTRGFDFSSEREHVSLGDYLERDPTHLSGWHNDRS